MEIKNIVLATDLSPRSKYALDCAIKIASQHQAHLTILHVPENLPKSWAKIDSEAIASTTREMKEAEIKLREWIKKAEGLTTIDHDVNIVGGKPFIAIVEAAYSLEADILVLGAHGKHFFRDVFIGTTAEKVARQCDRSVLVVRNPSKRAYKRVLIATDFSTQSKNALEMAFHFVPDAEFHILHAYQYLEPEKDTKELAEAKDTKDYMQKLKKHAKKELDAFLNEFNIESKNIKKIVEFGYPPAVIRDVVPRRRPDLVVVGATGETNLRHILLGSTAQHVLHELTCDVLVVRFGALSYGLP